LKKLIAFIIHSYMADGLFKRNIKNNKNCLMEMKLKRRKILNVL